MSFVINLPPWRQSVTFTSAYAVILALLFSARPIAAVLAFAVLVVVSCGGPPPRGLRGVMQYIRRIRCWFRGYHVKSTGFPFSFRYDRPGICRDCGVVGSGIFDEDGE